MSLLKRLATVLSLTASTLAAQRSDTVVRNATRPLHTGVATLQRELTIGISGGDDHYVLGAIVDVAVSATGNIYVWDFSVPAILMYDASGKYMRTIGRRGSGPGEYASGAGIAIGKNGNLVMWDPGNARVNVYTPTGNVVTSWPTMSGGSGSATGSGLVIVDTAGVTHLFTLARRTGKTSHESAWIRFRADGTLKDTVFAPPGPADNLLRAETPGARQFSERYVPFTPHNYARMSPFGYFVTGYSNRIAIDIHEPGKPIASIRRDVARQPVSAKERDSARAEIFEDMRAVVPTWSWNGGDIPAVKPAHSGFTIDASGRVWVQLAEGPQSDDTTALGRGNVMMTQGRAEAPRRALKWSCPNAGWSLSDVYEPNGRYLGQVRMPARIDPIVIRGDFVWAATCDADDAPSVGRYRIVWR